MTDTLIPSPATATRNVVEVTELTKHYGSATAVDSLSFQVPAGEVVGLLGPNGAGKTTAMKMLLGLVRPTTGQAVLLGAKHDGPGFAAAVRRVGALIEAPALYDRLSARQNLELQARALGENDAYSQIDELLELVDLTDRAGDDARTYSFGMKQRLGIAVAMMGRPELVILDEPANGLDPAGIVEIRNLLRRLPGMGTTVLVSSHQLGEVQQACDRLVILANGRLIASGTTADVLAANTTGQWTLRLDPAEVAMAGDRCRRHRIGVTSQTSDTLTIVPPDSWSGRQINRLLAESGIYVDELTRHTASLEQAFLDMTGAQK